MANINMDYSVMAEKARSLRMKEETIKSELASLQSEIQGMLESGFTTDSSSGAFGERFEEFKRNADNLNQTMSELGNQLDSIANRFAELDQSSS